MMLKILLSNKSDFEKSLKNRRLIAAGLLCAGLVGLACYFLLVPSSGLSDYIQGFYLGAASGITAGALILLVHTQYLLTHPEARKKAKVKETDEREVYIMRTSFLAAGCITFFAVVAAMFVVLPLSMEAFKALFTITIFYCLMFAASNWWLSRKV